LSSRGTWKKSERDAAETLGGKRIPVTGRHSGDVPDIEHPMSSETTGKIPLVTIEQAEGQGRGNERLALINIDDFAELLEHTKVIPLGQRR
jgi:hypothetical protein